VLSHSDPHLDERFGRAFVVELVGPNVTDLGEGSFDRPHDIGQADLARGATEAETALVAALARDDAGALQLEEDVEQELSGDVLGGGENLRLHRPRIFERGEFDDGPDRVIGFRGDPHVTILTLSCRLHTRRHRNDGA